VRGSIPEWRKRLSNVLNEAYGARLGRCAGRLRADASRGALARRALEILTAEADQGDRARSAVRQAITDADDLDLAHVIADRRDSTRP
jgi:hypothetical protein